MLKDAYTIDKEEQASQAAHIESEDDADRIAAVRAITVDPPPVEPTASNEEISEAKVSQPKQPPRGGIAAPGFSFDPTQYASPRQCRCIAEC
jgi:hypothetical protein